MGLDISCSLSPDRSRGGPDRSLCCSFGARGAKRRILLEYARGGALGRLGRRGLLRICRARAGRNGKLRAAPKAIATLRTVRRSRRPFAPGIRPPEDFLCVVASKNEARLLQHSCGSVSFESGRQRSADRRHRASGKHRCTRLDDTPSEALLCGELRRSRGLGGDLRRPAAQRARDVHHQRDQGGRLSADAVRLAPPSCLRGGRHRRRSLFARQIRHSHRTAAA